jgi:hypothetical protein
MDDIPNIPTDDNNDFMYSSSDYQSELMSFLSESAEMRRTAKGAVKQTLYSAGGAFVGSMVLGPAGGLIGGIVGSVTGYMKSDDYDGVIVKLLDLETDQKTVSSNSRLATRVVERIYFNLLVAYRMLSNSYSQYSILCILSSLEILNCK